MTDDELKAAAARLGVIDPSAPDSRPEAKLPSARSYLRAATWGLHEMVEKQHMGAGFIFHLVAIASVARAVPEVLSRQIASYPTRTGR